MRQNRLKRARKQKRKWRVGIALILIVLSIATFGYLSSQKNVLAQGEWFESLEENVNHFFSDSSENDIEKELTFEEVESLEKKL